MASDVIAQLTLALSKTHVGEELSYKGRGLKLDDKQSGNFQVSQSSLLYFRIRMIH